MAMTPIDGTPDAVKVARPVWRGGKSGDHIKGLPITICGAKFYFGCVALLFQARMQF